MLHKLTTMFVCTRVFHFIKMKNAEFCEKIIIGGNKEF